MSINNREFSPHIGEIIYKKRRIETILEGKNLSRDKQGNIVIGDPYSVVPARLAQNEINNLKEDLRNCDRILAEFELNEIKKIEISNNRSNTVLGSDFVLESNNNIKLDLNKQIMHVGTRPFSNFTDFFELLRTKDSDSTKISQIKAGVALMYAIARYIEEKTEKEHMLVSDLFEYSKKFKKDWNNWGFRGKGTISKNECIRVNEILRECELSIRFKLSKDKQEILVTK